MLCSTEPRPGTSGPKSFPCRRASYIGFRTELSLPGLFTAAAREEGRHPRPRTCWPSSCERRQLHGRLPAQCQGSGRQECPGLPATRLRHERRHHGPPDRARGPARRCLGQGHQGREAHDRHRSHGTPGTWAPSTASSRSTRQRGLKTRWCTSSWSGTSTSAMSASACTCSTTRPRPGPGTSPSLGHGYHKKGEPNPKVGGLHPHCRCTMVTLMPGYGFDAGGMIKFKGVEQRDRPSTELRQERAGEEPADRHRDVQAPEADNPPQC
jgi:hypothetical protein